MAAGRGDGVVVALTLHRRVVVEGFPLHWLTRRVVLYFGSANHQATVWVKGQRVGSHEGGHLPFHLPLAPLLLLGLMALLAVPLFVAGSDRGWRGWRAAMDRCGFRHYATTIMLFHTSICVKTFSHFDCEGPYEDSNGKERYHLATDYTISCDDSEHRWFSYYAGTMLVFYVFLLPAGVLLFMGFNRRGPATSRQRGKGASSTRVEARRENSQRPILMHKGRRRSLRTSTAR